MEASLIYLSSDAKMLERLRQGKEDALLDLYHQSWKSVLALITRNSGTSQDAEDLLQDALVILWERIRTGRFEYRAQLTTFVYATVHNLWRRRLSRLRKEIPSEMEQEVPDVQSVSALETMISDEQHEALHHAMEKLVHPCKDLLLLFYWEECSMEEIAHRLGFANAETAKSKKYQCKKALEQLLREGGIVR